ncbi:UNVERIFIED_CONTAM: hypothetical protein NCL1_20554 [Trichonephila clavipes]
MFGIERVSDYVRNLIANSNFCSRDNSFRYPQYCHHHLHLLYRILLNVDRFVANTEYSCKYRKTGFKLVNTGITKSYKWLRYSVSWYTGIAIPTTEAQLEFIETYNLEVEAFFINGEHFEKRLF